MRLWLIRNQERLVGAVAASTWLVPTLAWAAPLFNGGPSRGRGGSETTVTTPNALKEGGFDTFSNVISNIFNIVIVVAGIVFVVLLLLGGIQYLGAAGNEENTKKARQLMLDAVIGLVIVITAWAVGTYVLDLLGLTEGSKLNLDPETIR